jgi:hypothetical protein
VAKTRVKVVDRGAAKLLRATKELRTAAVRVGILGGNASAGKRQREGGSSDASVALVAAAHELGLGVPLRSWLRTPIDTMRPEIEKRLRMLAQKVAHGDLTVDGALEQLGLWLVGELQKGIAAGLPVTPLAPATIAKKGSSKPLIDTGQMRSSISHEVVSR